MTGAILSKLKKALITLALFAVGISACFAGCGTEGNTPPENASGGSVGTVEKPDESADDGMFTVTLTYGGERFTQNNFEGITSMKAVWTSITLFGEAPETYEATFDVNGVARAELDGDFKVTLSGLPDGYTYDPSATTVSNGKESRKAEIVLYRVIKADELTTVATGKTNWFNFGTAYGAYRIPVTGDGEFKFSVSTERGSGVSLTSIIDVVQDNAKAQITKYVANAAAGLFDGVVEEVVTDGGAMGTYTKNFRWKMEAESYSQTFFFGVKGYSKDGVYPINVDVLFLKEKASSSGGSSSTIKTVTSEWDFEAHQFETPTGTYKFLSQLNGNVLADELVEKRDGLYYYRGTDKLVYATLFTGSISALGGSNFSNQQITLRNVNNKNYENMIRTVYKNNCINGRYPVNDELKKFLQDYAIGNQIFFDGHGFIEGPIYNTDTGVIIGYGMSATKTSMWMFACGIFE